MSVASKKRLALRLRGSVPKSLLAVAGLHVIRKGHYVGVVVLINRRPATSGTVRTTQGAAGPRVEIGSGSVSPLRAADLCRLPESRFSKALLVLPLAGKMPAGTKPAQVALRGAESRCFPLDKDRWNRDYGTAIADWVGGPRPAPTPEPGPAPTDFTTWIVPYLGAGSSATRLCLTAGVVTPVAWPGFRNITGTFTIDSPEGSQTTPLTGFQPIGSLLPGAFGTSLSIPPGSFAYGASAQATYHPFGDYRISYSASYAGVTRSATLEFKLDAASDRTTEGGNCSVP